MHHFLVDLEILLVQCTLHHLDFEVTLAVHVIVVCEAYAIAALNQLVPPMSLPPPVGREPRKKLLVARFLDAHQAQGAIEQHSYDMLHRMILMISAMGQGLHGAIQSRITHPTMLQKFEFFAQCLREGCEVFSNHFLHRAKTAQRAKDRLPKLDEVAGEGLEEQLRGLREILQ
jgi:hypothetical protein